MTTKPNHAPPQARSARLPRRWAAILAGSIMLHLILLHWADGNIGMPSPRMHDQIMVADLRAPDAGEPAVLPKPKLSSKPIIRARKRPPRRSVPAIAHAETPNADASMAATTSPVGQDAEIAPAQLAAPQADSLPDTKLVEEQYTADEGAAEQGGVHYKIDPAPSAELKYDVQALREGQMVYGRGKIHWQTENGKYSVTGEAGVLFFTVLQFKSEGALDDFGVAPALYSEKRFRKSETNTHFNRDDRNSISFSASTAS